MKWKLFFALLYAPLAVYAQVPYPAISFEYDWRGQCIDFVGSTFFNNKCGFKKVSSSAKERFKRSFSEFIAAWHEQAPLLFDTVFATFGCGFKQKKRTAIVSLTQSSSYGSANILFLGLRHCLDCEPWECNISREDGFINKVFHELLHIWVDDNISGKSALLIKYHHEHVYVRDHIHLMALQKMVYLKLNRSDMLEHIDMCYRVYAHPEYTRAWQIVNDIEGYEAVIKDIHDTIQAKEIMSYDEYSSIKHSIPYTFELSKNSQHLFYFGGNHSCDPLDMQYSFLENFWNRFMQQTQGKNCIVLVEGQLRGGLFLSKKDAIINGGSEGGFVTFLAHQNNIDIECPEPNDLYDQLITQFSRDEVDYKDFAQCVLQFNRCKKNDRNLDFNSFFLSNNFGDSTQLEHMKNLHKKLFNRVFNPHDEMFFYHITNPVETKTIINHVCRQASILRDTQIIKCIKTLINQGKNVFVVYGHTHAIMQEKALKAIVTRVGQNAQ